MQRLLYDLSFILRSSHEILSYEVNTTFHEYLRPIFDAVHERTGAFRSASASQVDMHGKTLRQKTSSIVLYPDCSHLSSVAVSSSVPTTSNPLGSDIPPFA